MRIIRDFAELDGINQTVLSIGNFDGVHAGHRVLLKALQAKSMNYQCPSVVFTFDPHPLEILRPDRFPPKLTLVERKAELLKSCGVDFLFAYPTKTDLLEMSYVDFFEKFIRDELRAKAIVEGPNFYFGKDRIGNVQRLGELCRANEMDFEAVQIIENDRSPISSSVIRRLLEAGEVGLANQLLVEPYQIEGVVVAGDQRGRQLGFPTANLQNIATLLPGDGVYSGRVSLNDQSVKCAINIGSNPTFNVVERKVEVHLIDATVELYDQMICVEFIQKVRDVKRFSSAEELRMQIESDVRQIRSTSF